MTNGVLTSWIVGNDPLHAPLTRLSYVRRLSSPAEHFLFGGVNLTEPTEEDINED